VDLLYYSAVVGSKSTSGSLARALLRHSGCGAILRLLVPHFLDNLLVLGQLRRACLLGRLLLVAGRLPFHQALRIDPERRLATLDRGIDFAGLPHVAFDFALLRLRVRRRRFCRFQYRPCLDRRRMPPQPGSDIDAEIVATTKEEERAAAPQDDLLYDVRRGVMGSLADDAAPELHDSVRMRWRRFGRGCC
jgi:hypothetical protein